MKTELKQTTFIAMRIYLFRHGDKERSPANNPPLSRRGLEQARALTKLVRSGNLQKPEILMCSPKVRAVQTLTPLSQECQIPLKQTDLLDERKSKESAQAFFHRVQSTLQHLEVHTGATYLVTHFDWIEVAMLAIPSDTDLSQGKYQGWAPAQYMEFEVSDGVWRLQNFSGVDR
jgi:broad specificity phosphatase PhoE